MTLHQKLTSLLNSLRMKLINWVADNPSKVFGAIAIICAIGFYYGFYSNYAK